MIATIIIIASLTLAFAAPFPLLDMELRSVLFSALAFGGLVVAFRKKPVANHIAHDMTQPVAQPAMTIPQARVMGAEASAKPTVQVEPKVVSIAQAGVPDFYEGEATRINEQLEKVYKLPCKVIVSGLIKTNNFIIYPLRIKNSFSFSDLEKITDSLAHDINRIHRSYRFGEISVVAVNKQPPVLQVSRAQPKPLLWSTRPSGASLVARIGEYTDGVETKPLEFNLAEKSSPYVVGAFVGASRSGKSEAMHVALGSLIENTSPDDLEIYGIDITSADTFAQYKDVPHFKRIGSTIEEAVEIVELFNGWCQSGKAPDEHKVRLLAIDEFQELMTDTQYGGKEGAFIEKLVRIAGIGGKQKLRLWMVTQNPDKDNYPESIKGKTHFWVTTHMLHDKYLVNQCGIRGAAALRSQSGDILFKGPFLNSRATAYWMTDQERKEAIVASINRWGNTTAADQRNETPKDSETTVKFPVGNRELTPSERAEVRRLWTSGDERLMWRNKPALNRLLKVVYGEGKGDDKMDWLKKALDEGGLIYEQR